MVNPVTVNLGIIVPLTGADVDLWGEDDINPNMVAIDGLLGGVQTVSLTNVPVTLTSPAGFVPTPSPGPTESQNRVLRFTGALTGNVRVTLPLPGAYLIDNRTTGNFVVSFQGVTDTEVVAVEQGAIVEVYNDGANVRFVNLGRVGQLELWGGRSTMPAWVAACTVKPYLYCDGTVYNFSDFPYLAAINLGNFGGNGITTFATQDLRGRLPLAYDGTGTRITVAGCGINGQTMGASLDKQTNILLTANLPPYTPSGTIVSTLGGAYTKGILIGGGAPPAVAIGGTSSGGQAGDISVSSAFGGVAQGGSSVPVNNVQPVQVTGIWVQKT